VAVYDATEPVFVLVWLAQLADRVSAAQEPEPDLLASWLFTILEIVYFDEAAHYRPILVTLRFLGPHQIGKRYQFYRAVFE